jgi:hypothetical protein
MKSVITFCLFFGLVAAAYVTASFKLAKQVDLKDLRINMTLNELENKLGAPFSRDRNTLTYILEDSSHLKITLREGLVASAVVKFQRPLRIENPDLRKLTLVQIKPSEINDEQPSWFFAGRPEEGLIYKVTHKGEVKSLTWVAPFTYGNSQKKNLQALLQDFQTRRTSNL